MQSAKFKHGILVGIGLLVAGLAVAALLNRQYIQDWLVVQQYDASEEVSSIADRTTMTSKGRFLFYASRPQISDATHFNSQCQRREQSTAVLGCYHEGGISLFRVENPDLKGVTEVTAAHETLHAVWERLSDAERARLTQHLTDVYRQLNDPELNERMSYYDRTQPGEQANELHSILGTEVAKLDQVLEEHYKQYFSDRQQIVSLHASYAQVFASLNEQAKALKAELEETAKALNADIERYNAAMVRLNQNVEAHNQRASQVDRTNGLVVARYNATRAELETQQEQLATEKRRLDERSAAYTAKLNEYNALALRSETLSNSLDSLKAQSAAND